MTVNMDQGGKGGGRKSLDVDVNLVPFIDLLSALVAFLIITAVWNQTARIEVDQGVNPNPPPTDTPPPEDEKGPINIEIQKDQLLIGRVTDPGGRVQVMSVPKGSKSAAVGNPELKEEWCTVTEPILCYDYPKLQEQIIEFQKQKPDEELIIVLTDDGVAYKEMIKTMDLTRSMGFPKTLLSGQPE